MQFKMRCWVETSSNFMWKLNKNTACFLLYKSQITFPLRNILSLDFQGRIGEKAVGLNSQ